MNRPRANFQYAGSDWFIYDAKYPHLEPRRDRQNGHAPAARIERTHAVLRCRRTPPLQRLGHKFAGAPPRHRPGTVLTLPRHAPARPGTNDQKTIFSKETTHVRAEPPLVFERQ